MDDIADLFGCTEVPASWKKHWEAYTQWRLDGRCENLQWELPENASEVFDLPAGVLPDLNKAFTFITASSKATKIADLWHYLIFHLPESTGDNPSLWPLPYSMFGELAPLFPLAVLVSGTDHALDAFGEKGVSEDIARQTLGYSGYFVRIYHKKHGFWGLDELGWLRNFVRADIFQMGRLSFMATEYNWPFRAFRSRKTGEIITLCESRGHYRSDGLADGTNSVYDPDAWNPCLEFTEDTIIGNRVSDDGKAVCERCTLDAKDWEQVLAPGNRMIEVHIPAENGKLTPDECVKSYRQAIKYFSERHPGTQFAAFTCWSWLLDPGLAEILPPDSNIVKFQKSFHLLPVIGDHYQAYDLVFGSSKTDIAAAPQDTYLQREIVRYVEAGNMMRSCAGFITWDEVIDLVTEQSA